LCKCEGSAAEQKTTQQGQRCSESFH
jgi:hypothetical protein